MVGFEKASDFILRYQIPEIDNSLEGKGLGIIRLSCRN